MKPPCVILAGGRSSRMGGGDKAFILLQDVPMLEHVLGAIRPQVDGILINSNSSPRLFARYGLPVLADTLPGHLGPLAGLLTGMLWARAQQPHATHILSVACDTPHLPQDLVEKLYRALDQGCIAIACDDQHRHPTIGLWPVSLAEDLYDALTQRNLRAMQPWARSHGVAEAHFPPGVLENINTPTDLSAAGKRQGALPALSEKGALSG